MAEDILDRGALRPSDMMEVLYPDGRGSIVAGDPVVPDEINGFMLTSFGGTTVCERLLEIASITQSLIFWPCASILFAVTDRAHLAHLPQELLDENYVAIVKTVDELWEAINAEEEPPIESTGAA